MELKKKIKNFFTLTRKANGGFTLVELIVVIAILAILASVGSAGYGAYIKASNKNSDRVLVGNIRQALESYNNAAAGSFVVEGQYSAGMQIPVGYVIVSKDAVNGRNVNIVTPGSVENPEAAENGNSVLADAIEAAYGKNYATSIRLKSDDWDGTLNGLFFQNAAGMIEDVEKTGEKTLDLLETLGSLNFLGTGLYMDDGTLTAKVLGIKVTTVPIFSQGYEDGAELLLSVSEKVSAVDKDTFVNSWDNANSEAEEFGVSGVEGAGREHYSAVRAAYNNCFANFVTSKGSTFTIGDKTYTHDDYVAHAGDIKDHGQPASELLASKLEGLGVDKYIKDIPTDSKFPQAVCDSVLAGGDGSSYTSCDACKALLKEYKDSEQDKTDAASFYDTMTTGATDGGAQYDPENPDAFYDWMQDSADAFSNMYTTANEYTTGSSIALEVYYNSTTRLLDVRICPLDADPRN